MPSLGELLAALLGNAAMGVGIVDRELRYVYINPALATLNGIPAEAHLGRRVREVLPVVGDEFEALLRRVIDSGQPMLDLQRTEPDPAAVGQHRFWRCSFIPIPQDGIVVAVGALIFDMTAEKRGEQHRALLEDQLRQAQKLESLGRLTGGIAHDFNNLLTAILGHAELILDDSTTPASLQADVRQIHKAARSAADLTKRLLAFSRNQTIENRLIDVNAVVSDVGAMLGRVLREDISLTLNIEPAVAAVAGDPSQLEHVIMNLTVNARDAMPNGGTLTVETANVVLDEPFVAAHRGTSPGHYVSLVVQDTGTGMDEATRSHLFEPFFSTKPQGKGTGLGLAMVYGAVKQMGGTIWVDTTPGVGSTFTILLPAVVQQADAAPARDSISRSIGGTETVLVVDDQAGVRQFVARVLTRNGYAVVEAETPREALRLVAQEHYRFSLLVTDVVMPLMTGRHLARLLREILPTLRVVYMSGYTDTALAEDDAVDDRLMFIRKPFTQEALLEKIRFALESAALPPV